MLRTLLLITALSVSVCPQSAGGWKALFDGKSLENWMVEGGADLRVVDGVIIGLQGPNNKGGDLYSRDQWLDFEVEAEFQLNTPANSGLWFRKIHGQRGCQVDLLDEPQHTANGLIAGSIYCEGKGFLVKNSDPTSYRQRDWNTVRLRAEGEHIEVFMNGQKVGDLREPAFVQPGRIGFQVHGGTWTPNMELRIRRVRIRALPAGSGIENR